MERRKPFCQAVAICVLILALSATAQAQYGGGTGEPNDPYLIYTPEQLNAIGADPNDWDKHFKLMADIDLAQYSGTEFNIIGSNWGNRFKGTFDGCNHVIRNFTYTCEDGQYIGVFGYVEDPNAAIGNLGLISPHVDAGTGHNVGSLVGYIGYGIVTNCYVSGGIVAGGVRVGGLIGCDERGLNYLLGSTRGCYATATVMGKSQVGGLAGFVDERILNCYAIGVVIGDHSVGGLVGCNGGAVENCYSAAVVLSEERTGGLVGGGFPGTVFGSFWDIQASRQPSSVGGVGKTTAEMQTPGTFRAWGDEDNAGVWTIDEGNDYPRLAWEGRPGVPIAPLDLSDLTGTGTADDPYLLYRADEIELIAREPNEWGKHFKLMADIDLGGCPGMNFNIGGDWNTPFTGVFDGNGHTIANFTYVADEWHSAGFFSSVKNVPCGRGEVDCDSITPATIKNLGLVTSVIDGRLANCAGALVGDLWSGTVSNCYVEGGLVLGGREETGGLVGYNHGAVVQCYVVGSTVIGGRPTGSLVGGNGGSVTNCYSMGIVTGTHNVGGLVGRGEGSVANCYSASAVTGDEGIGGLVGGYWGEVIGSFWDSEASGQTTSNGGVGLMTSEMQMAETFLAAGWDFVGEVENGEEDIWYLAEGDYPRLAWELDEVPAPVAEVIDLDATNFSATIAEGVVLVDFYATWCSHCVTQAPILDEVAEQVQGSAQVGKLDIDTARSIAQAYGVTAIPTLIVFKDGDVFERFLGVTQASTLVAAIERALAYQPRPR